jgi:hypothetical protein
MVVIFMTPYYAEGPVGIELGYGQDGQGSIPGRGKIFSYIP